MKTFSSIYPFTNRLELRRATCISGGAEGGGGSGDNRRLIRRCPIWENCGSCVPTHPRQYPPEEGFIPLNCPRCGGEFEIREEDENLQVDFPTLGDKGRLLISGKIARHNLHRHANPSMRPYRLFPIDVDEGRLRDLEFPSREERMDLFLQGLGCLFEDSRRPLVTENTKGWEFLLACACISDMQDMERIVQNLMEKGFVRLSSKSLEITEDGRKHCEELVEAMRRENPEKQDG